MKTKHTPGPWYYSNPVSPKGKHLIVNEQADVIAEIKTNEEANAILIAAAPELLEALKDAERLMSTWSDGVNYPTLIHIRETIKKATE